MRSSRWKATPGLITGDDDAGNVYTATRRVDEEGMPKTFIYSYDSLGLSMERTISDIVR